jgi:hypothetical protein
MEEERIGMTLACRLVGLEDLDVCPGLDLDGHALDSYHGIMVI